MTCKLANQLRTAWYSVATPIPCNLNEDQVNEILEKDRANPAYQKAKKAYMDHLASCDECYRGSYGE